MHEHLKRRTFAIISHPDAGKTTLTEKLLLFGGAIQMAGAVKGRKATRHATSDWMRLEQERGISVTSSVMQFPYGDALINLLDTPGHEDFSEDTYRTLTAVDSALMVIDAAKGVEARTIKLMEVCRLRTTPIISFINKLDRDGRPPIELLDDIETVLDIACAPLTWPIGMGREFRGIYRSARGLSRISTRAATAAGCPKSSRYAGSRARSSRARSAPARPRQLREEVELVRGATPAFDHAAYLAGKQTPVFFGAAIHNYGVRELLDAFAQLAPPPQPRATNRAASLPDESAFSGFVFKIQANMDPAHRDRIAFLRMCSGTYEPGMRMYHTRFGREVRVGDAITFMAADRQHVEEAYAGDIIGLHNHGTINIGDSFTQGEAARCSRASRALRRSCSAARVLRDPLKLKALQKGLAQLCEEGATQLFRPSLGNDLIFGRRRPAAIRGGCVSFARRVQRRGRVRGRRCRGRALGALRRSAHLDEFVKKLVVNVARDHAGQLVYLAPSTVSLALTQERWPKIQFFTTRESSAAAARDRRGAHGAKRRDCGCERGQRRAVGVGLVARAQIELDDAANSGSGVRQRARRSFRVRARPFARRACRHFEAVQAGARTPRSTTPLRSKAVRRRCRHDKYMLRPSSSATVAATASPSSTAERCMRRKPSKPSDSSSARCSSGP